MRGEETRKPTPEQLEQEIPPHARRREVHKKAACLGHGNNSACAEKSHLVLQSHSQGSEIPPHARRRDPHSRIIHIAGGNTSACAEKRLLSPGAVRENRKYLHMRGEEMRSLRISWFISEIPPHARRRDPHSRIIHIAGGNTSACAEKSISCPLPPPLSRKYLRMRGEESPDKRCHAPYREISPHARRRVPTMVATIIFRGNTSACAEKSVLWRVSRL